MKFGAIFEDFKGIECLKRMLIITEKQSNEFVIVRLTADTVYIITNEGDRCKIWSQVPSHSLFSRYIFEGISSDCNETCLQLNGNHLTKILRNVNSTMKKIRLKLVKGIEQSYITVEIEMVTNEIGDVVRVINHNLEVVVVSRRFWPEIITLDIPESDVSVFMPPIRIVRNVIEKMRHWDSYAILSVKRNGETSVTVRGPSSVSTKFKPCELNKEVNPSRDESIVRLEIKRISLYFNNLHVNCHTQCFITHERYVRFKSMFEETCFQFILPHICE